MRNLPPNSATWRAQHPDEAAYASPYHVALMLADIYDAVAAVAVAVARSAGAKAARPDLYPRPGKRSSKDSTQRLGSGAIPVSEFDAWYYGRRSDG